MSDPRRIHGNGSGGAGAGDSGPARAVRRKPDSVPAARYLATCEDIPDAPSTVQPPTPKLPAALPPEEGKSTQQIPFPGEAAQQPDQGNQAAPPMPPVETIPAGSRPRNQINPKQDLYTISVSANVVQIP